VAKPAPAAAPARGTRPGNRRELVIAAASDLFAARGYANVGMGDIAQAVNVGASAIYRHFASKSDLLLAAVESGIRQYSLISGVSADIGLEEMLENFASCALDNRTVGVLWQRESRNLAPEGQRAMRDELRRVEKELALTIEHSRPGLDRADSDLLAWSILGVLVSVGFHSLSLPRDEYLALLVDLCGTLARLDLYGVAIGSHPTVKARAELSRRDALISKATELFAERGFGAAGIDDIAEAVGIAGPSVYAHFASKQDVLAAAIARGGDILQADAQSAVERNQDARATLTELVESYVGLATNDRFLIRMLLSELDQLPDDDRHAARQRQREYIDLWSGLLQQCSGDDTVRVRIRVQATLIVVSDIVQTRQLRARPGFEGTLRHVAEALLGL